MSAKNFVSRVRVPIAAEYRRVLDHMAGNDNVKKQNFARAALEMGISKLYSRSVTDRVDEYVENWFALNAREYIAETIDSTKEETDAEK